MSTMTSCRMLRWPCHMLPPTSTCSSTAAQLQLHPTTCAPPRQRSQPRGTGPSAQALTGPTCRPAGAGAAAAAGAAASSTAAIDEGVAAACLSDVLLQLFPTEAPQALWEAFRAMASLLASPALPPTAPSKTMALMESHAEVLGRLLMLQPPAMAALVEGQMEAQQR